MSALAENGRRYEGSALTTTVLFTTTLDPAYALTALPVAGRAFCALVFRLRRTLDKVF